MRNRRRRIRRNRGLVTIEDLLEEIVGEIRDEYDVESEQIVDEGNGRFLFTGMVNIDEVAQRLNVQIEREGFETVGGYRCRTSAVSLQSASDSTSMACRSKSSMPNGAA